MRAVIRKALRTLEIWDDDRLIFACRAALGSRPVGAKRARGDGKTPEGAYRVCLVKPQGRYGKSLGLSYPNGRDAREAYREGRIDEATLGAILAAEAEGRRPPWGTALGGEIYLHAGGSGEDWTAGCIALDREDMDRVYAVWEQIDEVRIEA